MSYIKWAEISVLQIYSVYKNINAFRIFDLSGNLQKILLKEESINPLIPPQTRFSNILQPIYRKRDKCLF